MGFSSSSDSAVTLVFSCNNSLQTRIVTIRTMMIRITMITVRATIIMITIITTIIMRMRMPIMRYGCHVGIVDDRDNTNDRTQSKYYSGRDFPNKN